MARKVKEEEYSARRKEILDAARKLVYTKGFELMTIQDILDDLKISKGAFYHYFSSKLDVQEALVEQMALVEVVPQLQAIIDNPHLTALEKLHRYFDTSARWKSAQKEMIISLMRVWYSDENVLFRQKMSEMALKSITPLFGEIVRQGIQEGVFNTPYPDQMGQIILNIMQGMSDTLVELLLNNEAREWNDPQVVRKTTEYIAALSDAMERVLGAPKGSIHPIEPEALKTWFVPVNGKAEPAQLKNEKELQS